MNSTPPPGRLVEGLPFQMRVHLVGDGMLATIGYEKTRILLDSVADLQQVL